MLLRVVGSGISARGFKARIARRFFGPALAEKATSRLYTCVYTCHARDYAGRRTTLRLFFCNRAVPRSSVCDAQNLCARIILERYLFSSFAYY